MATAASSPSRKSFTRRLIVIAGTISFILPGCRKPSSPIPATNPSSAAVHPTVASVVPAATDLLLGMGAGDHLVAVGNYDAQRPGIARLPRIGDYQNFDWEQLSVLRPDILIVFMKPDRMPPALRQRAEQLHITLVNVQTERLPDIYAELDELGKLIHEPAKAAVASAELRRRLEAVRQRVQGKPPVRTLIVREAAGDGVVGRDTFVNDILEIAGGTNVIETIGWPSIDRETLVSLKPDVIVQLLPEASPQVKQQAQQVWQTVPTVPAVAHGRVYILDQWWTLQPALHMADLAETLAGLLHPAQAEVHP